MKRALVTGASSGIGREFALQLARRGYAVTCVARRQDRLEALVEELEGTGHRIIVADLSKPDGVDAVAKSVKGERTHVLINNAGYSVLEPFSESSLELQQNILAVNCGAVVTLAHAFLRQAEAGDALINVSSVVAYLPTPAQPMYSASKAFISALSECLWQENLARDVYVMGLCPGVTSTEFISTATRGESDGENLPKSLVQSTEEVVIEALRALDKRKKSIIITGGANRLMAMMPRFLSRHRLMKIAAVMGDPEKAL